MSTLEQWLEQTSLVSSGSTPERGMTIATSSSA